LRACWSDQIRSVAADLVARFVDHWSGAQPLNLRL
jgi:hypothetical protein